MSKKCIFEHMGDTLLNIKFRPAHVGTTSLSKAQQSRKQKHNKTKRIVVEDAKTMNLMKIEADKLLEIIAILQTLIVLLIEI